MAMLHRVVAVLQPLVPVQPVPVPVAGRRLCSYEVAAVGNTLNQVQQQEEEESREAEANHGSTASQLAAQAICSRPFSTAHYVKSKIFLLLLLLLI